MGSAPPGSGDVERVPDLRHGREVRESPERPFDEGAIPLPPVAFVEAPRRRVRVEDPQDRSTTPERPQLIDRSEEKKRPDATATLIRQDVDRVDLTHGPVVFGPDFPLDEPDESTLTLGHEGPAIGGPLAQEPLPVVDAFRQRQGCGLAGCDQRTIRRDPAPVVKLGRRPGVGGSRRSEGLADLSSTRTKPKTSPANAGTVAA